MVPSAHNLTLFQFVEVGDAMSFRSMKSRPLSFSFGLVDDSCRGLKKNSCPTLIFQI